MDSRASGGTEERSENALYVSPDGDDSWSGRRREPNDDGTDGPFATLDRARIAARQARRSATSADAPVIRVRGGRYELTEPLRFEPGDSGVTFEAYPGEEPVLDGGRRVEGWEQTEVNGVDAWVAHLPAVEAGEWYFRQLFVDGERRPRARLPKGDLGDFDPEDFFWIEDVPGTGFEEGMVEQLFSGTDTFVPAEGDIDPDWRNTTDVDLVALHYWIEERLPIESVDAETNVVVSSRRSTFALIDDVGERYARYYVENVFEALTEPGEWYLDRPAGKLYYVPREGERPEETTTIAPVTNQFVRVEGDPDEEAYVDGVQFEGLTFRHAGWEQPTTGFGKWEDDGIDYASAPQAAIQVPGVLSFEGATNCAVEDCTIEHVGWYGVELGDGCQHVRVVGNEIRDLGAGGVKLNGADATGPRSHRTGHNRVTDNHIEGGGQVFHSAVGILARHTFDNELSHNHIHDLYYTGISCGWEWGFYEHVTRDNRIEHNHIHDIGQGLLSDMGGIYTLGVQPGTVLRGNHIHDVEKHNYGGWAIYLDEGTSHLIVEDNVCHDTDSRVVRQHYGRENTIRNNVFAFGRGGQVGLGRAHPIDGFRWKQHLVAEGDHDAGGILQEGKTPWVALEGGMEGQSYTFARNVVLTDGAPLFVGREREFGGQLEKRGIDSDLNLFWDVDGGELICENGHHDEDANWITTRTFEMDEWHELGYDRNSIVADPAIRSISERDFRLTEESPACDLAFEPIDLSDVGPRR